MTTIIGYIGLVILLSALLVIAILARPERFNLDEESEALRKSNEDNDIINKINKK